MTSSTLFQASASIPMQRVAQAVRDISVADATERVAGLMNQGAESFAVFVVGPGPVTDGGMTTPETATAVARRMRQVLTSFSGAWRGLCPSVARVGDDRFLVVIEQIPSVIEPAAFAEVLVLEGGHLPGPDRIIPLRAGVATADTASEAAQLIRAAEDAFWQGQHVGRVNLAA